MCTVLENYTLRFESQFVEFLRRDAFRVLHTCFSLFVSLAPCTSRHRLIARLTQDTAFSINFVRSPRWRTRNLQKFLPFFAKLFLQLLYSVVRKIIRGAGAFNIPALAWWKKTSFSQPRCLCKVKQSCHVEKKFASRPRLLCYLMFHAGLKRRHFLFLLFALSKDPKGKISGGIFKIILTTRLSYLQWIPGTFFSEGANDTFHVENRVDHSRRSKNTYVHARARTCFHASLNFFEGTQCLVDRR